MKILKKIGLVAIAALLLTACGKNSGSTETAKSNSAASDYPKKPVEVIVGFGAGGETDTIARLVFQYASKYFDQNFAIINKPGASGELAWSEVAKAKPDGYTIAFINPPTFVSHPVQRANAGYQIEDFRIIANMVKDPACIVVPAKSDINTMEDFVEKAKENQLSIGYSGPGSSEALTLRQLEELGNYEFDKIPYDGSASSVVALLGGQIDSCILNVSGAINYTNDGSVKIIGVASKDRSPFYPDVPTFEESGIKIYNDAYRGVAAPKDVPEDVVDKIEEAINKALEDPEFKKRAEEMKLPIYYQDSDEFTKTIEEIKVELTKELEKGEW